jgi:dihydrofolate reductase
MNIIVAVDNDWGIGRNGQLLFRIPEDMQNFRSQTMGKVVVMGRGTFDSLPKKQPLVHRENIVLSAHMEIRHGVSVCRDPASLFEMLSRYDAEDVFVIGGASVYCLMLEYCRYAFVTRIFGNFGADRFFPNIGDDVRWKLERVTSKNSFEGVLYRFEMYSNQSVKHC